MTKYTVSALIATIIATETLTSGSLAATELPHNKEVSTVSTTPPDKVQFELSSDALAVLKRVCEGPFKPVTLPFDQIELDQGKQASDDGYTWTAENADEARAQGKKFPELAKAIEGMLAERMEKKSSGRFAQVPAAPQDEYSRKLAKWEPYVRQESDIQARASGSPYFWIQNPRDKKSREDAATEMETRYKGQKLNPRYMPISGFLFLLPGASSSDSVKALKAKLQPLGYDVFHVGSNKFTKSFRDEHTYRKYLKDNGLPPRIGGSILPSEMQPDGTFYADGSMPPENFMMLCSPPSSEEFDFDPSKPIEPQHFFMLPGETIEKLGPTKWRRKSGIRITLHGEAAIGLITKKLDPDNLITYAGSSGPNYNIINYEVADQVAKWNADFGVDLVSLGPDRFSFQFKKMPEDLSGFIQQAYLIDPDFMEMPEDEGPRQAAAVREMANRIRRNNLASFWWD